MPAHWLLVPIIVHLASCAALVAVAFQSGG